MKTRILIFIIVLVVGMCGCSLNGYHDVKPDGYPATNQAFDITFGWKKSINKDSLTIEGYARNNRYFIIQDLVLRVSLVTANATEKTVETFFFILRELREDKMAPFVIHLKVRPQAGDRLRFNYRYMAVEGSSSEVWMNSFEVNALD